MDCHKCPYNGKGDPRCLSCPGPSDHSILSGPLTHSLESMRAAGTEVSSPVPDGDGGGLGLGFPPEAEARMADFLYRLFNLSETRLLLVRHVFRGGTLSAFARERGISRQRASNLARMVSAEVPALARLFGRRTDPETGAPAGRFRQDEFYLPAGDGGRDG